MLFSVQIHGTTLKYRSCTNCEWVDVDNRHVTGLAQRVSSMQLFEVLGQLRVLGAGETEVPQISAAIVRNSTLGEYLELSSHWSLV